MARPSKNNAEYFSHDADMRNDVKVKALRRRFQHKGYAVWCFILEALTDADFFEIDYDEVSQELLAADFDITVEELKEIVEYCNKIGLLQMTADNKVYSEAHKRRFTGLVSKRERDRERLATLINKRKQADAALLAAKTNENDGYHGDNPHSKVKENKIEETKIEKTKEKKNSNIKYPYQGICDLWNSVCVSLPKVAKITEARKQKIKSRLDEFGCEHGEWLTTAETLFRRVQESDFLTGRKGDWKASFDWFFDNGKNWVKVSEGNYDNKGCGFNSGRQAGANKQDGQLGVGEYFDRTGRRTYGSGRATIPNDAPPRPSDRHQWSAESNNWIIL